MLAYLRFKLPVLRSGVGLRRSGLLRSALEVVLSHFELQFFSTSQFIFVRFYIFHWLVSFRGMEFVGYPRRLARSLSTAFRRIHISFRPLVFFQHFVVLRIAFTRGSRCSPIQHGLLLYCSAGMVQTIEELQWARCIEFSTTPAEIDSLFLRCCDEDGYQRRLIFLLELVRSRLEVPVVV